MRLKIEDINIDQRIRHDVGDLTPLNHVIKTPIIQVMNG